MSVRAAPLPVGTAFARGPFQAGGVVILNDEEAHHLKVRRIRDGDPTAAGRFTGSASS